MGGRFSVYSATKAAIRSFARSWTLDLKQRWSASTPSALVRSTRPPASHLSLSGLVQNEQMSEQLRKKLVTTVPLGRMGSPDEVAVVDLSLWILLAFCLGKTLILSNANNNSWTCLQRVLCAERRHRTIRFFVTCVMTTSVLKIVTLKNTLDHGRNFDILASSLSWERFTRMWW